MSDLPRHTSSLSSDKLELFELLLRHKGISTLGAGEIPRQSRESTAFPLSYAQERLWFLDQWVPGSPLYNIRDAVRLSGPLDVAALDQSLNLLVERHETLRTTFAAEEGRPLQVIAPHLRLTLPVEDLQALSPDAREAEAQRLAREEAGLPFDLARGPLLRARLLRLGPEEHVLLLGLHHIISDGWSVGVLRRELAALYAACATGQPSPLPELPLQYVDYAHWQREWLQGERLDEQLAYWRKQLADIPVALELPTDHSRPAVERFRGALYRFTLSPALATALRTLSQREGTTLFMTLLAAFQVLLWRYTGQEDVVVGSPITSRTRPELEGLIGFFVNTLVLRTDLAGNPTFCELLGRVRETCLGAYAHQDLPFERLVEELQPERDVSRQSLFQVVFQLLNVPLAPLELAGLRLEPWEVDSGTAKFDLSLFLREEGERAGGGLVGLLEYNTDLFERESMERLVGHYQRLLEGVVSDPEQPIAVLPLLGAAERQRLLVEWTATQTAYPREASIPALFEAQAARTPEAVAVVFERQELTYSELNRRANQLAHHLQRLGVGPDVLVGLCVERSLELIVGLLGILKAGGAYVPLDPSYPPERLAVMLADAQVPMLLTQQALLEEGVVPAPLAAQVVCLDRDWQASTAGEPEDNPPSGVGPEHLAYVSYTSGSTGTPKGVCVPHRGVVRLVKETNYARLTAQEVILQLAPVAFDASTLEIWGALLNGARLVVFPPTTPSLAELSQTLRESGITTLWLTAGLFHQMVEAQLDGLKSVRQLLAGGDVLSVAYVRQVLSELGEGCCLINGYGPTENTTFACCYPMTAVEQVGGNSVPIGRPIANTQVYLLDARLAPVPIGVPGELYIGGDGLARGYLNRPDLTAERFVPHPFSQEPGARLYRTGDRARWRADGTIEFLGRLDTQMKIRGYRIEPGEIEAALSHHPSVREAVTLAREDTPGDKRLVAYIIPHPEHSIPTSGELRRFLHVRLPDYMVPSAFMVLEALPITANGKLDRRALPAPDRAPMDGTSYVAPRTSTEEMIAGIWCEVLGRDRVGVYESFFEVGGHSLLATQVIARVRRAFQVDLPLRTFFEAPTVANLAEAVAERQGQQTPNSPPIHKIGSKDPEALLARLDQLSDEEVEAMLGKLLAESEGHQ